MEQLLEGCSDQNAAYTRFACGYLSDLLILAMAETASCGGNRSIVIIQRVMAYIDDDCARLNLFVTMIAEENDVSPSCLAQIFKKKTGHSTADYIHMTRLKSAKRLLKDNRVKNVAEMVGYQDVRSLIRVFKKYEAPHRLSSGTWRSKGDIL